MSKPYFMGIDGGGSTLRIAITDDSLKVLTTYHGSSANPNIIGHDAAVTHVQSGIQQALQQAKLSSQDITAVGIGIAGASNLHSETWLIDCVQPALHHTLLIPSSDLEIALVGALNQRHGILVLAGTGSAILGRSPDGQLLQLGGWGYLLDDDSSGYSIGLEAIKRIIQDFEQNYAEFVDYQDSSLNLKILDHLGLTSPRDLIHWLYRSQEPPVTRVAPLAKLIIGEADNGNWDAINLLQKGASRLASKVELMIRRLDFPDAPIAFGGGLLDNDNRLSRELTVRLGLPIRPIAKHSPVIGGALLAQLEWKSQKNS
jgi:N-acetylglucosamine kinase-like BadF-type ATPase